MAERIDRRVDRLPGQNDCICSVRRRCRRVARSYEIFFSVPFFFLSSATWRCSEQWAIHFPEEAT